MSNKTSAAARDIAAPPPSASVPAANADSAAKRNASRKSQSTDSIPSMVQSGASGSVAPESADKLAVRQQSQEWLADAGKAAPAPERTAPTGGRGGRTASSMRRRSTSSHVRSTSDQGMANSSGGVNSPRKSEAGRSRGQSLLATTSPRAVSFAQEGGELHTEPQVRKDGVTPAEQKPAALNASGKARNKHLESMRRKVSQTFGVVVDKLRGTPEKEAKPDVATPPSKPGAELANKVMNLLSSEQKRQLGMKIAMRSAALRSAGMNEEDIGRQSQQLMADELKALNIPGVNAALQGMSGEAVWQLGWLRAELELRGAFAEVSKLVDHADPHLSAEMDRIFHKHLFGKEWPDVTLPSSLAQFKALPPFFVAQFGQMKYALTWADGRELDFTATSPEAQDLQVFSDFVGRNDGGLFARMVSLYASSLLHDAMQEFLFDRLDKQGGPESELRSWDGTPLKPVGKADAGFLLEQRQDGSVAVYYTCSMSRQSNGGKSLLADRLGKEPKSIAIGDPRLQVDACILMHLNGDPELQYVKLEASGWNKGR